MIRTGDLVEYIWQEKYNSPIRKKRGVVFGTSRNWWVITKHIDIAGKIVSLKDVKLILPREKLKKWWNYLNR